MNIRETAVHVTAKKIAYRQTRDGNVVSFAMDPKDVPDKLATDPIGTSYMLALVEVDDATGQPKGGQQAQVSDPTEAPRPQTPEGGARKTPAQVAGYLCTLPSFHSFLLENVRWPLPIPAAFAPQEEWQQWAAETVRKACGVSRRRDITEDNEQWRKLRSDFRLYEKVAEIVP